MVSKAELRDQLIREQAGREIQAAYIRDLLRKIHKLEQNDYALKDTSQALTEARDEIDRLKNCIRQLENHT